MQPEKTRRHKAKDLIKAICHKYSDRIGEFPQNENELRQRRQEEQMLTFPAKSS